MNFSPQQGEAVDAIGAWLREPHSPQVFYLAGYAGTGKTTLAKYIAQSEDDWPVFAAYTGKAASVMRRKGCTDASTIHKLIYTLVPPDIFKMRQVMQKLKVTSNPAEIAGLKAEMQTLNKPKFIRNDTSILNEGGLVVIDEVSMVNEVIGKDLLSFGNKILVLGDPGQLPPIEGAGYFTSREPDFLLTEIHRQAQDSPIINMATLARQGRKLSIGHYGNCVVRSRHSVDFVELALVDQVIVGLNRTRKEYNSLIRDELKRDGSVPVRGDKLICLKNNHEVGILNGTQWDVDLCEDHGTYYELNLFAHDEPVENPDSPMMIECHPFTVNPADLPWYERKRYQEFDYGYAITCHKSQGSQWPVVYIQNESYAFREDSAKWLYTALTRAETKVIVGM